MTSTKPSTIFVCSCNGSFRHTFTSNCFDATSKLIDVSNAAQSIGCLLPVVPMIPVSAVIEMIENRLINLKSKIDVISLDHSHTSMGAIKELESLKKQIEGKE